MALTTEDLPKLNYHGVGHPLIKGKTASEISDWYNQNPTGALTELVRILSPLDRKNYFAFTDFPTWYSQFCQKIIDNTTVKLFGLSNDDIDDISVRLLAGLIQNQLTEHTMQKLVQDMLQYNFNDLLADLLICLGADNKFFELTLVRLNIELVSYPRWMSVGLSIPPTEQDCIPLVINNG